MTLCIVHKETEQIMYKFRRGEKTDEHLRKMAEEFMAERFPSKHYELKELELSTASGRERTGYYIRVKFMDSKEPVVIGHRYTSEKTADKDVNRLYMNAPGVENVEVIPASEALM